MTLAIPDIQTNPTFDGQSVPDSTDWLAFLGMSNGAAIISGCEVTAQATPDMTVQTAAGSIFSTAAASGTVAVSAVASVAVGAASATDRKDIVVVSSAGVVSVVAGTPCGTAGWTRTSVGLPPVKPAVPSGSVLQAEIYVAYNTTAISASNIIDKTAVRIPTYPVQDSGGQVFNVKSPVFAGGAKIDGSTDDTAAVNAALAAAFANGGSVFVPPGVGGALCLCLGAIDIPYTGGTTPVQNPVRMFGSMPSWSGNLVGMGVLGGSGLDLRFAGDGGTHVAKIDTRGRGRLEIDHLIIKSGGTDNFPILQTTNTTVAIHDNLFWGNPANTGTACLQDAIILGGIGSTEGDNGPAAWFQGYGTVLRDNVYHQIRRTHIFGCQCNGFTIENELIDITCGSAGTTDGPYYFNPASLSGGANGGIIRGGIVEVENYSYGVSLNLAQSILLDSIGMYDSNGYTQAPVYCGTGSAGNLAVVGWTASTVQTTYMYGPTDQSNSWISNQPSGQSYLPQSAYFGTLETTHITTGQPFATGGSGLTIDSGTAGSGITIQGYQIIYNDYTGTQIAELSHTGVFSSAGIATAPATPAAPAIVSGTVYQNTSGENLVLTVAVAATVAGTAQWALGPTATPSAWGGATTTLIGTVEKNLTIPNLWYYSLTVTGTATITAYSRSE